MREFIKPAADKVGFADPSERESPLTEELMRFCVMIVQQDMEMKKVYDFPR